MDDKVNFGFHKVELNQKTSLVKEVFSSVAKKYDLMNDIMSFGLHRLWKKQLLNYIPITNLNILDMAGGTGDITIQYIKRALKYKLVPKITLSDINKDMLEIAKNKLIDLNYRKYVNIIEQNAEILSFENNNFDYYIIAFGIRNITKIEEALSEAYRVLKPGGKFICLEFSKVSSENFGKIYDLYLSKLIPKLGRIFASDEDSYRYLIESIKLFPDQEGFSQMVTQAGFERVKFHNLLSGITSIHIGYKI